MSQQQINYIKKVKRYNTTITSLRILVFIIFVLLWETAARLNWINPFVFSSPSRVVKTLCSMYQDGTIFKHIGITLSETFLSFALIAVIGISAALLLWMFTPLCHILEPYLIILNSLPKSALAPMLIVWLGNTPKAIIVTAISIALFGTILNIYTAFTETDPEKIKLMRTFKASRIAIFSKLVLPASLNTIVSIMKVNIGLCLVGVVIGEFLAARSGLGYLIIYSSQVFRMDAVVMSIIILCIVSVLLFKLTDLAEKIVKKIN